MITMIKGPRVPGAAEKAATDANFFPGQIQNRDVRVNVSVNVNSSGLDELERRVGALGSISASIPGGITGNPSTIPGTTDGGGRRGSRDSAHIPQMAEGGIVRARPGGTLVRIGEAGRWAGMARLAVLR